VNGGLYQIRNTENGHRYVGRAVNFAQRWSSHKYYLKRDGYKLPHLQAAWNKYGEAAFAFEPLVVCSPADAVILEQLWLDHGVGEYNVSRSATTPIRGGDKLSAEHRAKISAATRGKPRGPRPDVAERNRSMENRTKISAAMRGKAKPWAEGPRSPEVRAKLVIACEKARAAQAAKRAADPLYAKHSTVAARAALAAKHAAKKEAANGNP
jgi:group I intron endonuclease